ncbi:methyltransferase RsmF C-terminal domain-like protein [Aporhodopirellula aestuarii]|uniref:RNA methylase, NOL1/NOP2/sun family protein n=1 Tax=Aporhodopirellula aestuarii TaxID=2950107 RepID=A0ABT0U8X7_9BACT|nr:RNA methylase, NOL1/NOP2/sun family protein [Aporhodopirellula aestuarii]MCM2372806.1 RNA methylase, NOL1/NOP2/sun family protein [Aporhodopirellula aestuarii]
MSAKKKQKSKSGSKRPPKRSSRRSGKPEPVSREGVEQSLHSQRNGEIRLPDEELTILCDAIVARHENVLRLRRDAIDSVGERLGDETPPDPVPWYPLAIHPPENIARPSRSIDYASGEYYLQDAGSLLALAAAEADTDQLRGKLICDLCAAPGGKASALLEAIDEPYRPGPDIPPRGFLLANEPIRSRVAPLAYNLARTGSDQYAVTSENPEALADKFPELFDFVLVDAPCSGQAMMARGKQSPSAVQASHIALNADRQNRILTAAERLLRPGGTIVYSTCTFAIDENEGQVRFMIEQLGLNASPMQRLEPFLTELSDCPAPDALRCSYRLWPHRNPCAGSFAARLSKPVSTSNDPIDGDVSDHDDPENDRDRIDASWRRSTTSRSRDDAMVPRDAVEQLPFLIRVDDERYRFVLRDWIIEGNPPDAPDWVSEPCVFGPEVAHRTGTTWKPSHAAALRRTSAIADVECIEVDDETALKYLAGETIPATEQTGWLVVRHRGRPLGWIKSDGRIGKNHLARFARLD